MTWLADAPARPARARRVLHADSTRRARRPPRPPRVHGASERDIIGRRGERLRAPARRPWTSRTPSCGAFCVANVPRPPSCSPRRGNAGAQRWLDDVRHRRLDDHRRRPDRAGPRRRRGGRGAGASDGGDARRPRAGSLIPAARGNTLFAVTFRWEDDQLVADLPHARAVFSTARGGVSTGPFASLNLGLLTDDAPENVAENRRRLGEFVGHPWPRFCYGRQVHGATVRRATEPPSAERPYTEEDGQATALTDAAAIVFVADCLPVLLAAPRRRRRAALRLAAARGRDRRRGRPRAARGRGRGADQGRARAERARLLLRGRRGGPRALRGLRRAPRGAQPGPGRGGDPAARSPRHRGLRRRPVHDLRRRASSRTAATRASPAARRGSYAASDHRPRRVAHPRQPRARALEHRRRRTRSGRRTAAGRRQVRAAGGDWACSARPG